MENQSSPSPVSILFARGVLARLAIWSTLRIAVQEGWGGSGANEKRTWLAGVIVDAFEEQQNDPPDDQYIEELLLQVMADEFETHLEDGSAEGVARDIVKLWAESCEGKQESVLRFEELANKVKGKKAEVQYQAAGDDEEWEDEDGEDDSSEDGEDEQVPRLIERPKKSEPEVDEDGFTLVKGKGRR